MGRNCIVHCGYKRGGEERIMSEYFDDGGLQPVCRCGERMVFTPSDDYSTSEDYEWLCPCCDAEEEVLVDERQS